MFEVGEFLNEQIAEDIETLPGGPIGVDADSEVIAVAPPSDVQSDPPCEWADRTELGDGRAAQGKRFRASNVGHDEVVRGAAPAPLRVLHHFDERPVEA